MTFRHKTAQSCCKLTSDCRLFVRLHTLLLPLPVIAVFNLHIAESKLIRSEKKRKAPDLQTFLEQNIPQDTIPSAKKLYFNELSLMCES
jgi:hypothetical protein